MPSSPGDRPSVPVSPVDVADWETRRFARLRRYAPIADGTPVLDDLVPDVEQMLADPELARSAIADEIPARG